MGDRTHPVLLLHGGGPVGSRGPIGGGRPLYAQAGGALPLLNQREVEEPAGPVWKPGDTRFSGNEIKLSSSAKLLPLFGAKFGPTEVMQGLVNDCSIPAVLAAIANCKDGRAKVQKIVSLDTNIEVRSKNPPMRSRGLVVVVLGGKKIELSRLLYRDGAGLGDIVYAQSNQEGAGWVSFIEKAFAWKEKGYANIAHLKTDELMEQMLGSKPERITLRESEGGKALLAEREWAVLRKKLENATAYPTVAVTPRGKGHNTPTKDAAVLADHASAVLGCTRQGVRLWDAALGMEREIQFSVFRSDFAWVLGG